MARRGENRKRLTKAMLEKIQPGEKDIFVWDSEVVGFGCKITTHGARTYFVFYRTFSGQQRRIKVGTVSAISTDDARKLARKWLTEAAEGKDPGGRRKAMRQAETVADLIKLYLEYAGGHKKPRSLKEDRRNLEKHVKAAWGTRKAESITRADVARLHHAMRHTPTAANRVRAVLSNMFAMAETWGLRAEGSNPVRGVKPYKEERRERYLSPEELARLDEALETVETARLESPQAVAALRLLLFTGCRLSEVLNLEWAHVDFEEGCLNLPDSKTGARKVYLNTPAAELLARLYRGRDETSPWVWAMENRNKRLYELENPWRRIRKRAGLEDVHIHDLRHTFASMGAGMGMGLPQIGKLLGHTQAATTQRYSHLAPNPARAAAEVTGAALVEAIQSGAKVVDVTPAGDDAKAEEKGGNA
jgi:integrase